MNERLVKTIVAAAPDGVISVDRLAALAPIESMSGDETAQLILDLERAGVSVEIDPALAIGARSARPPVVPPSNLDLGPDEPGAPVAPYPADSLKRPATTQNPTSQTASRRRPALTILLVLLAIAVLWFILRRMA